MSVLRLAGFEVLGAFGAEVLRRPYGLAVVEAGETSLTVYVTDNYEMPAGEVPPESELGERVRTFVVDLGAGSPAGDLVNTFGDTEGPGVLHKVESIAVDPLHGHLLIADELDGGYWVTTDQTDHTTWFRLFERGTLEYVGTIQGETTRETDGIAVTSRPIGPFGEGAVFAVHADMGLTAFDWFAVRRALSLDECAVP